MTLIELLIVISITIIGLSFMIIMINDFYLRNSILLEKQRLNLFLEECRVEAKVSISDIYIYFIPEQKRFIAQNGEFITVNDVVKDDNLIIKYNIRGRIAIINGSSTIRFSDNTEFKILPVTGRVVF